MIEVLIIVVVSQDRSGDVILSSHKEWAMQRAVWAFVIILLVLSPALDLAWNEPVSDGSPNVHCQLHATPAVAFEPGGVLVMYASERFQAVEPHDRLPLVGASIDIPPRV